MNGSAVVDASVALKWILPEPDSARATILCSMALIAPDLLLVECANALWVRVRRSLMSRSDAEFGYSLLRDVPVEWVPLRDLADEAMALALDLDRSAYDCAYLALAASRSLPLITADARLIRLGRSRRELAGLVTSLADIG